MQEHIRRNEMALENRAIYEEDKLESFLFSLKDDPDAGDLFDDGIEELAEYYAKLAKSMRGKKTKIS